VRENLIPFSLQGLFSGERGCTADTELHFGRVVCVGL
jgi:hypothetical protein